MITSVPLATSSLSGVYASKLSEANEAGRMFAKRLSALRRARIPCSGRTGELGPHFGPPTDPIIVLDGHTSSHLYLTHQYSVRVSAAFECIAWKWFAGRINSASTKQFMGQVEFDARIDF